MLRQASGNLLLLVMSLTPSIYSRIYNPERLTFDNKQQNKFSTMRNRSNSRYRNFVNFTSLYSTEYLFH